MGSYSFAAKIQDYKIKWKVIEKARKYSKEIDRGKGEYLSESG
jgi:hypothetical protein